MQPNPSDGWHDAQVSRSSEPPVWVVGLALALPGGPMVEELARVDPGGVPHAALSLAVTTQDHPHHHQAIEPLMRRQMAAVLLGSLEAWWLLTEELDVGTRDQLQALRADAARRFREHVIGHPDRG